MGSFLKAIPIISDVVSAAEALFGHHAKGQAGLAAGQQYDEQQAANGRYAEGAMQPLLAELFKRAGYDYSPGTGRFAGSLTARPYDAWNDPRYQNAAADFNQQAAKGLTQALAQSREGDLSGNLQRGQGEAYLRSQAADNAATWNRNYLAQEQGRQDQAFGQAQGLLGQLSGAGSQAAGQLYNQGLQQQTRGDAQTANAVNVGHQALGSILHQWERSQVPPYPGSGAGGGTGGGGVPVQDYTGAPAPYNANEG